jgi:hypothetical protein
LQAHTLIALAFFVGSLFALELFRIAKSNGAAVVKLATAGNLSAGDKDGAVAAVHTVVSWALAGAFAALGTLTLAAHFVVAIPVCHAELP